MKMKVVLCVLMVFVLIGCDGSMQWSDEPDILKNVSVTFPDDMDSLGISDDGEPNVTVNDTGDSYRVIVQGLLLSSGCEYPSSSKSVTNQTVTVSLRTEGKCDGPTPAAFRRFPYRLEGNFSDAFTLRVENLNYRNRTTIVTANDTKSWTNVKRNS